MPDELELVIPQETHGKTEAWTDIKWSSERATSLWELRTEDIHQGGLGQASRRKLHLSWIPRYRYNMDIQT